MKYFTKEVRIALTGIVAIVILFVGINFLKGINVFKSSNTFYIRFHNINGLTVSSPVYANGYSVGIVRSIAYDYDRTDNVVVCVDLDKNMVVPAGTRAELESQLMGGVTMSLVLGQNPTVHMKPGDTIEGGLHVGALNKLEAMIPTLEQMMPKLDSILGNLNRLTADPALAQTLQNTAALTANLKETSASLNTLMRNDVPQLTARLNRIGGNVETFTGQLAQTNIDSTINQVNTTLGSVTQLTNNLTSVTDQLNTKLNSKDNTLGLFLNDRSVYDNLSSTLSHADSLMIDLKSHPKRYVHFSIFGKKDK